MHGDNLARARRRIKLTEYAVVVVAFLLLAVLLTAFKLVRIDLMYGDSAMLFQATENLAARGLPVSQVQEQIVHFQNVGKFQAQPVDQIAADPGRLFGFRTPGTERNVLLGHAYLVLFPLAQLVRVIPVRVVLLGAFAAGFAGVLILAYVTLRRRGVSVLAATCFCVLIMSHPAWWQAVLWGQFYPDRLFVFTGFALMVAASRRGLASRTNELWVLAAGIACASINERGAIVAGIFLIVHTLLFWRVSRVTVIRLAFGVVLFVYGYFVIKVVLPGGSDYGGFLPSTVSAILDLPQQPLFQQLMPLFLLVNAPFLLLAAFEWRALVIALILMVPNVIGNIGGAEKVGWLTHYPSFFVPSLLWAAMIGFSALSARLPGRRGVAAISAGTLVLVGLLACVDPNATGPISVSPANTLAKSMLARVPEQIQSYIVSSPLRDTLKAEAALIDQTVPSGSTVSSIEAGMPLLYQGRTLDYFPEGLDGADFAALGAVPAGSGFAYNGAVSYLGAAEQAKMDRLVEARLRRDGYDVDHPIRVPALDGMAIVKRIRR